MENPWKNIPADDYERHMSDPTVGQLSLLSTIFQNQYQKYAPHTVVYFGVCTGNGLEHIDPNITSTVVGVDINKEYLAVCDRRFRGNGYALHLINADLNNDSITLPLPSADLFVANLVLEYVDLQRLLSVVKDYGSEHCIVSIVIQVTHAESFVSKTNIPSLEVLSGFHVVVDEHEVVDTMTRNRFELLYTTRYHLPGKKEFIRFDFQMG